MALPTPIARDPLSISSRPRFRRIFGERQRVILSVILTGDEQQALHNVGAVRGRRRRRVSR